MRKLSLRVVDTPITKEGLKHRPCHLSMVPPSPGTFSHLPGHLVALPPSGLSEFVHPLVVMPPETLPSSQAHSNYRDRGTPQRVTKNHGNDTDLAAELGLMDGLTVTMP